MYNVVVADDEPIVRVYLEELLYNNGYNIVGSADDGYDAIELCKKTKPDFVILDVKMPIVNGIAAAKIISKEELAGFVLLLTAYKDKTIACQAAEAGVMGYIIKPVDEGVLIPAVEIAISKYNEIKKLNKECQKAKIALEERKYVDQAKNIIMNKYNISEKEAYTYIRKTAMDKGCKIGEIAKFIINSN